MIVVAITGHYGAGKDLIADWLVEQRGFKRVRWADELKEEVLRTLPRTLEAIAQAVFPGRYHVAREKGTIPALLREMVFDLKQPIVRALLQEWGTQLRRAEDPEYWLKRWFTSVYGYKRVVAPDTRFVNEVAFARQVGAPAYILRVNRPGCEGDGHISEREMQENQHLIDTHFQNDSTIDALLRQVQTWADGVEL